MLRPMPIRATASSAGEFDACAGVPSEGAYVVAVGGEGEAVDLEIRWRELESRVEMDAVVAEKVMSDTRKIMEESVKLREETAKLREESKAAVIGTKETLIRERKKLRDDGVAVETIEKYLPLE
mmetsp:Transcript_20750/g.55409  ORF Transcript_20750/g.55409 Transcript_20750/m.55409 type:complete len:124 (+) Transcript_20750:666-1037(+)